MSVCGSCGFEGDNPWGVCEGCGMDLSSAAARAEERPAPVTAPVSDDVPAASTNPAPVPCAVSGCGGPIVADRGVCALCGTPASGPAAGAGGLVARFPWGDVPVPAAGLELGREAGGPAVEVHLAAFDNVSRRHARIGMMGGSWVVRDLDSTNGTWVDDSRLAAGEDRVVRAGSTVRLAAHLRFELHEGPPC